MLTLVTAVDSLERRGRCFIQVAAVLACLGGTCASDVRAGTFHIGACGYAFDGATNNAWTMAATSRSDQLSAAEACPADEPDPYGTLATGLSVTDRLSRPDSAGDNRFAEWRFTAPIGTNVVAASVDRDLGNRDDYWRPYGRLDSSSIPGETCVRPVGQPYCRVRGFRLISGVSAQQVAYGIRCPLGAVVCPHGVSLHHVWSIVRSASVTLSDHDPPAAVVLNDPGGSWHSGPLTITATATDNTGIRQRRLYDGAVVRAVETAPGAAAGGCGQLDQGVAYTYTRPCAGARGLNGERAFSVDTRGWADGSRTVRVGAVDTGGLETRSAGVTVRIDNHPPPAPTVTADQSWAAGDARDVRWTVPVETDRAPIDAMDVQACPPGGACAIERLGGRAGGAAVEHRVALPSGVTQVRVRLLDAAGNVGAWSEPVELRRDVTPPEVVTLSPSGPRPPGAFVPSAYAVDRESGVARTEIESQVDGGAWLPVETSVAGEAGRTYRLRARAGDRAGNVGPWREGAPTVVAPAAHDDARAENDGPDALAAPPPPIATPQLPLHPFTPRRDSALRIRTIAVRGRRLRLTGTIAVGHRGRVRLLVRPARRSTKPIFRVVRARAGRWTASIRLHRDARRGRVRAAVTAHADYRAATTSARPYAPKRRARPPAS
jgi:hypothetical protein